MSLLDYYILGLHMAEAGNWSFYVSTISFLIKEEWQGLELTSKDLHIYLFVICMKAMYAWNHVIRMKSKNKSYYVNIDAGVWSKWTKWEEEYEIKKGSSRLECSWTSSNLWVASCEGKFVGVYVLNGSFQIY